MVTATDDQSDRLTALETEVSELRGEFREFAAQTDARLSALEAGVSDIRADIRALNARQDRYQAEMNERLDRYQAEMNERQARFQSEMTARLDKFQAENAARIDRVFWAVVGAGVAIFVGAIAIVGAIFTAIFRLT